MNRSRKRRVVNELSKGSCYTNCFLTKRRLKDPKNEGINRKKSKINKKKTKLCANFEFETHFQALQNTSINFRALKLNIAPKNNHFSKKIDYKQKNWSTDKKTAKNRYLYAPFSQKLLFKVKKSFTKRSARSKNFSRSEKISSYTNFTHFQF